LAPLGDVELMGLVARGTQVLNEDRNLALVVDDEAAAALVRLCDGDARRLLGMLELAANAAEVSGLSHISASDIASLVQRHLPYDRDGGERYSLISALHKAIRSADPHGALYWCERMRLAGEDPRFLL